MVCGTVLSFANGMDVAAALQQVVRMTLFVVPYYHLPTEWRRPYNKCGWHGLMVHRNIILASSSIIVVDWRPSIIVVISVTTARRLFSSLSLLGTTPSHYPRPHIWWQLYILMSSLSTLVGYCIWSKADLWSVDPCVGCVYSKGVKACSPLRSFAVPILCLLWFSLLIFRIFFTRV